MSGFDKMFNNLKFIAMSEKKFVVSFMDGAGIYKVSSFDDVTKACLLALDLHRASNLPHAVIVTPDVSEQSDYILRIDVL